MSKIKVDFKDLDYVENINDLIMLKDLEKGTKAIKKKGEVYLDRYFKEDSKKYALRSKKAVFKNFFSTILWNTSSLLFRKSPEIDFVKKFSDFFENVNGEGDSLQSFMHLLAKNAIRDGLSYIWVDNEKIEGTLTKTATVQPVFKNIERADVFSKRFEVVNGRKILTQFVFRTFIEEDIDGFATQSSEIYVVLNIGSGKVYKKNKREFELIDSWENSLDYIPIVPVYSKKTGFFEADLALLDIAYANIKHYNKLSDLDHITYMTNAPILALYNFNTEGKDNVVIGSNNALLFEDKQSGGAEYIQPNGNGTKDLKDFIADLETYITKMSIDLITKDSFKTATEAKLREKRSSLFLVEIAESLETAINRALEIAEDFAGIKYNATVKLNKDFEDLKLDANTIDKLIKLKSENMISLETLWDALNKGEVLKLLDYEKEKLLIKEEQSNLIM